MEYNNYPDINVFQEGAASLGLELTDLQLQQFMDYYELLTEWNKVMNLTTILEFKEVMQKHFIDSLSIVKVYGLAKQRILDVGTGAGFPGIPIKIVFPETDIVLMDSLNKRIHFLEEVIQRLGLKKITAVHGRAEEFAADNTYRECFDLCVSRAVAKLGTLSEYCLPYVKTGGYFIPYKSGKVEDELSKATHAFNVLGAELEGSNRFLLPGTDMERTLIKIHKIKKTPIQYPRAAGKPVKEPL